MDSQRFDSLVKSLARATNRRAFLKGLFGLGGATLIAGPLFETQTEAARRPKPAPKPPSCPGQQYLLDTQCVCPSELHKCGPDCCAEGLECCDNACCDGHCSSEEICCPWDNWCESASECCSDDEVCCGELGCQLLDYNGCCGNENCPEGFDCCGGGCCASGFCAHHRCCALGVCGDGCLSTEGNRCCNGIEYDPETQVCCDSTVFDGECCSYNDCDAKYEGICWDCTENHQCKWEDCA